MAVEKYREASLWWDAFEKSVHKRQTWKIYYIAYRQMLHQAEREQSALVFPLRKEMHRAYNMFLETCKNVTLLARAAIACELGGRVYEEESEHREWAAEQETHGGTDWD